MSPNPVPPVESIDKRQWQSREYAYLDHFVNFARLANAVITEPGPLQGWFGEALWRNYSYAPFNLRVMENYYSLAFFYGYNAPWNIYYRQPDVLTRLEMTLRYTFERMGGNGAIPEYAPVDLDTPMLAPSSFGMEYMAAALDVAGAVLPPTLRQDLIAHARQAAVYVLTSDESWDHARDFTNQFFGAMAGGARLARLTDDADLKAMVGRAYDALLTDTFIAPMGFLYENAGPETFSYFFVTLRRLIHLAQEWPDERLTEVLRRHCAWMSRWLLPEPDGETILLAGAHQTRSEYDYRLRLQRWHSSNDNVHASRDTIAHGLGILMNGANADERRFLNLFLPSAEQRTLMDQNWRDDADPIARSLAVGRRAGYPPVSILNEYEPFAPPAADVAAARQALPCLSNTPSAENLQDERGNQYLFLRQPNYYLAMNFAARQTKAQHGPSLLWHPQGGTVILSENSQGRCWETQVGEQRTGKATALATLREGRGGYEVILHYDHGARKAYVVRPDGIDVQLGVGPQHAVAEQIPLLLREDDVLHFDYGTCSVIGLGNRTFGAVSQTLGIERGGKVLLRFDFGAAVPLNLNTRFDDDGLVRAQLLFRLAHIYFGRTGYRLFIDA